MNNKKNPINAPSELMEIGEQKKDVYDGTTMISYSRATNHLRQDLKVYE